MARMIHLCDRCGKPCDEDPAAPVVITLSAIRTGDYNFLDLSDAPGWLRAVLSRPNPRLELCTTCASEVLAVDPAFVAKIVDREAELQRIPEAAAAKMKDRAKADARTLGEKLAKTPKPTKE
jgi:hypothetical protein